MDLFFTFGADPAPLSFAVVPCARPHLWRTNQAWQEVELEHALDTYALVSVIEVPKDPNKQVPLFLYEDEGLQVCLGSFLALHRNGHWEVDYKDFSQEGDET